MIAARFIGGPKHGDVWAMRQLSGTINGATSWYTDRARLDSPHVGGMVYELRHVEGDVAWYGFVGFTPCQCGERSWWWWWHGLR